MRVRLNDDTDLVKEIQDKLKLNGGYCPCAVVQTSETKCMCKVFRDKIKDKIEGECHCGLYVAELE